MNRAKMGNPAVVGLGGCGMTTLIMPFHNPGWVGLGPVLRLGRFFGGTPQLIAGLLEFRAGKDFGFSAFTGDGGFWVALCLYLIEGTNPDIAKEYSVRAARYTRDSA